MQATTSESESDLKRRIDIFLTQKGISPSSRLHVDVGYDTVTFEGTVDSFYERQLCLACQHVPGVRNVVDGLKVSPVAAVGARPAEAAFDRS